jgi:spore coat polysaccharide biosynthesis predicted glycosyltransferase SpsG
LVDGRLEDALAARARRIGIEAAPSDASDAVVVVDLPDLRGVGERAPVERLVVFDDRDAFEGAAGLVIQPSMPRWAGSGHARKVLAGFSYAPVARAYVALRERHRPTHRGRIELIVCFGGSDPAQVTRRLAGTLASDKDRRTTIVVGADYAGLLDDLPVEVLHDPADLPERLSRADLAVIGAGTMKFEVACLGRPAILLAVADDQLAVGPPFARTGAAEYLGDGRTIDPHDLLAALRRLLRDDDRRLAMGRAAAAAVDGGGAERVATAILSLAGRPQP